MRSHIHIGGVIRTKEWLYGARMLIPDYENRPVKVGITTDPAQRLKSFNASGPFPVECLGIWPAKDGRRSEEAVFARFQEYRLCGEWFFPVPELLEFIREHTLRYVELFARAIEQERHVCERARITREWVESWADLTAFERFTTGYTRILRLRGQMCEGCEKVFAEATRETDDHRERLIARVLARPYPLLLSEDKAADILEVPAETLTRLRVEGRINFFPLARKDIRYRHDDLLAFIRSPWVSTIMRTE